MDRKVIIAIVIAAVVVVGVVAATMVLKRDRGEVVYYINLPPKDMRAALVSGQVDAYIAWEPYVSDSAVDGVGEVLLWSEDMMPDHPCCVVAVSTVLLATEGGSELTKRFLKAHIEANRWMADALADPGSDNHTLLMTIATDFTARSESVVTAALDHMKFGYEMGDGFTTALEEFTRMYIDTNMTSEPHLAQRGYSSVSDFVSSYVNRSYLEDADAVQPSATIINPTSPIRLGYLLGDIHQVAQKVAGDARVLDGESLFQRYGLNVVDAVGAPFANGGAVMLGFAGGNVDIGYLGAPPALLQHLNAGVQTLIVAQANSEGSGLVVAAGSGVERLKDLVNKTVATPGESSIQFLLLKTALEKQGLDLKIKT